jgi:hypothetical protein
MTEIEQLRADNAKLRAFAMDALYGEFGALRMKHWKDNVITTAWDHGLIHPVSMPEPCGEICVCKADREEEGWPIYGVLCYRPTAVLLGVEP